MSNYNVPEQFAEDWGAENYPKARAECLRWLPIYHSKRNIDRSYMRSYLDELDQAEYLGITKKEIEKACNSTPDIEVPIYQPPKKTGQQDIFADAGPNQ